jgi:hypothetical protein
MEYWRPVLREARARSAALLGFTGFPASMIRLALFFAVLAGILFWGSSGAAHDELVARAALAVGWIAIYPLVFGFYVARVSREKYELLHAKVHEARYRILIEPQQVIFADFVDRGKALKGFTVTMLVRNAGENATSLTKWQMAGTFRGEDFAVLPAMINASGKGVYLRFEDSIPEKTHQPIPAGGSVYGHFMAVFPGDLRPEETRGFRISAEAADGTVFEVVLDDRGMPGNGFIHLPGMKYNSNEEEQRK